MSVVAAFAGGTEGAAIMRRGLGSAVRRILMNVVSLYMAFALFTSTMPYLNPPSITEEERTSLPIHNLGEEISAGGSVGLLETPADAFNARIEVIRSSEQSLDFVYHHIVSGDCAAVMLAELLAAAERGVRVRILVDGVVGISGGEAKRAMRALNAHPNIECGLYSPAKLLKPWEWHALLHDKMILSDGKYLITGGRNIADHYYAPSGFEGAVTNDRDILIWEEQGGVLRDVSAYIDTLWESQDTKPLAGNEKNPEERCGDLRRLADEIISRNQQFCTKKLKDYLDAAIPVEGILLLTNPIDANVKKPYIGYQLYEIMISAKQRVFIQTPYMTKTQMMLQTLDNRNAQAEFKVLTNSLASSPNYPAFSNYYTNRDEFMNRGAQIFEYQHKDSIHGKSLLIDSDISIIGSFNMDARSMFIDTESMFVIKSEAFSKELENAMDAYLRQSVCICERECEHVQNVAELPVPRIKRVGMQLCAFLSNPLGFLI